MGTLDGLPKQFVASMRTLFDIMDDRKVGYVHLADIESRWPQDEDNGDGYDDDNNNDKNRDVASKSRPHGVIESLRKVTPANGLLSFERFCAGLKICLLRNSRSNTTNNKAVATTTTAAAHDSAAPNQRSINPIAATSVLTRRPLLAADTQQQQHGTAIASFKRSVPSQSVPPIMVTTHGGRHDPEADGHAPIEYSPGSLTSTGSSSSSIMRATASSSAAAANKNGNDPIQSKSTKNAVATVRPNTVQHDFSSATSAPSRTVSMPHVGSYHRAALPAHKYRASHSDLADAVDDRRSRNCKSDSRMRTQSDQIVTDQRSDCTGLAAAAAVSSSSSQENYAGLARSRQGIMTVLHNWHMGMLNEQQQQPLAEANAASALSSSAVAVQASIDGHYGEHRRGDSAIEVASQAQHQQQERPSVWKSSLSRRREPRRHTLANGIDYNMLKRMKQLEQEKDVLLQGLEAVDKARAWYLRQIVDVQDKMKYIGHSSGHQDYSMEAHQERLNFEMAQIFEVNQNLSALVESSERGFPLHMNLAVRQPRARLLPPPPPPPPPRSTADPTVVINHVAELNRQLDAKSERINQLEMEKAALVRELFQARSLQAAIQAAGQSSSSSSMMIHRNDTTLI